ncbi:RadC family protein [Paenibacillus sp. 2TAB26]|uniref:JAB domain-containing protein n=1 Tax=Paenibacillus sp. 2TAB26 TaxID=3233005 RepID=UPI003F992EAA
MYDNVADLNKFVVREVRENYYQTCNAGSLSNKELMVTILAPLLRNRPISTTADDILQKGLPYLASLSEFELSTIFGLDEKSSFSLMAIFEFARRVGKNNLSSPVFIRTAKDAIPLIEDLKYQDKEHFVALFLNTKNMVIGREVVSIGHLNASLVHPRELFKAAIRQGAASIIVCHNHPSGDTTASPEDIAISKRITEAGEIIGISIIDHIIIGGLGGNRWASLKEQGLI